MPCSSRPSCSCCSGRAHRPISGRAALAWPRPDPTSATVHFPPVWRLLVKLVAADAVASYGVLLAGTLMSGGQGAALWPLAPVGAPVAVWEVTTDPVRFDTPWPALAVDGTYAACFAAT